MLKRLLALELFSKRKITDLMYEINIFKAFMQRDIYQKYRNSLQENTLNPGVRAILVALDYYWKNHSEPPTIPDIENIVASFGKKNEIQSVKLLYDAAGERTVVELLESLRKQRLYEELAIKAVELSEGGGSIESISSIYKELVGPSRALEIDFVTNDIESILNTVVRTRGLRWRLNSLNRSLGSLRKGDFGFVFGRPEIGKTTFLSSEASFMASQISETDCILWLNNEEMGPKVRLRTVQSCLRKTMSQLLSNYSQLKEEYVTRMGDRLRIYDSANIHRSKVERMCEEYRPRLVLIDQLDKIEGFEGDRRDLEMGSKYQWARELAKEFCPVIGICQADVSGEGVQWLTMGNVADAKTAKQAEADFIFGIGRSLVDGFEFHRYISICKNKLIGDEDTDPAYRHAQFPCLIRPEIALFDDL